MNHSFIYLIGVSDLRAVTEAAIVSLHLFALLFCGALSYGFYLATAMLVSSDMPAKSRMEIIEHIVMTTLIGSPTTMMSLGGALGVFAFISHLGQRYLASPLGQFIVGLPGVRLIPYVYRKYWLPSAVSIHPRPRFFYLKRLIIRQSNVSHRFLKFYFLNCFFTGVKIPLGLFALYTIIIVLFYLVAMSLAWRSLFMRMLEKFPWYGLLIYFFVSLFVIPGLLVAIAVVIYFVCKGFVAFIFEARKDFTVDIELVDSPV